jgi:enamine deaminase RidA (YjgF/YER057c/UK114 family)
MARQAVTVAKIAAPIGPFSSAVRSGDLIFISGTVLVDHGRDRPHSAMSDPSSAQGIAIHEASAVFIG